VDICDAIPGEIGPSTINYTFAEEGISICRALLHDNVVDRKEIVLLTPYEA